MTYRQRLERAQTTIKITRGEFVSADHVKQLVDRQIAAVRTTPDGIQMTDEDICRLYVEALAKRFPDIQI